MSDYVPTTERVRETYSHALWPVIEPDLPDYSQFDRWLEQHDAEISTKRDWYLYKVIGSVVMGYGIDKPDEATMEICNKIIELIKGEQK